MELNELLTLLETPSDLVNKVKALAPQLPDYVFDLEPEDHRVVKNLTYRPWRDVDVPTGIVDAQGNMTYRTEKRDVHRVPSSTQKQIINWSVQMALSGGIEREYSIREGVESDKVMAAMLDKTWEDNKLDYIAQKIDWKKKAYTQCLAVWYSVPAEDGFWAGIAPDSVKFKMRIVLLSPDDGDTICPIYDQYKDMLGCGRYYTVKIDDKDVNKFDLYLKDTYNTYIEQPGGWVLEKANPTLYGKANFVYHYQPRPEYADVLPKIERVEEADSDTADENQQSAFPILVSTGELRSSAGGGTKNTRKTFQMENGGDLKYVEAEGSQESATNERKNLRDDIYDETATPHISMQTISESGAPTSGVAIEMGFLPASKKAKFSQDGDLGMEWQRHLNFQKSAMAVLNIAVKPSVSMPVKPKFKIELPKNLTEEYGRIVTLVGAGLMSIETAIAKLGIVENVADEIEKIRADAAEAQAKALELAAKSKPVNEPVGE